MATFTEGDNCWLLNYDVDYRDLATRVILRGGLSGGSYILVSGVDEANAAIYGLKTKVYSESRWTTSLLAETRAQQILLDSKTPAISVRIQSEPQDLSVGDLATLTSTTLSLNEMSLHVKSIKFTSGPSGYMMDVELTNRYYLLSDFLDMLKRNTEAR